MANLFADENFPLAVVEFLRQSGHTVVTLQQSGHASLALSDPEVLALAIEAKSAVLTMNRWHFIRLHRERPAHYGIIVCTVNPDFQDQAENIKHEIEQAGELPGTPSGEAAVKGLMLNEKI